jgi:integrase
VAIDDAGMAACKAKLGELLNAHDQLLFRVLATTGMRLSEAFQIDGEQEIDGVRFVVVGTKTDASLRRVPLPADLLDYLPPKIEGTLLKRKSSIELASKAASKRLNDFLDDCGLTDPGIVVHSLRHRAARRLRAAGIQKEIRRAIGGWVGGEADDAPSEETSYGVSEDGDKGFPMPMLKAAIDVIGF